MSKIVCIIGPSGSGKSTIGDMLGFPIIPGVTTRAPRPSDIGYTYLTKEVYDQWVKDGILGEHTEYAGTGYGMRVDDIMTAVNDDKPWHAVVTIDGFYQFKQLIPDDVISIFVYTPLDEVIERMSRRGDSDEDILKRIKAYEQDVSSAVNCDYIIANIEGCLRQSVDTVSKLVL